MSGGPEAARREVRGAHAVEVDAPARWLGPDWVMLTTGVRLQRNPSAQRELVPQLEAEGVTALGFGVGLGFDQVPAALVDVAREHGFPVFAGPYETRFREIIPFVDSARWRAATSTSSAASERSSAPSSTRSARPSPSRR